ncbi:M3 family oligoendopeptidase [Persicimonas caeni]|uniref:M3 family oligoendopeptidase n=1 Tax=Persicimonas caeni TaxID=2292766 RepID=A0A4Y6PNH0_PERCE|nr:M3 family oligoendopeptidase [Persicimonas caeni]QDG49759.1 M3 family oligoendopeptidase [Persicimonas caeni]QED30980.1 M3 family oligoendopeptidase [Persicimonas caeni]
MKNDIQGFPTPDPSWDLDVIFPGGADSDEFDEAITALMGDIDALVAQVEKLPALAELDELSGEPLEQWVQFIEESERIQDRAREAGAFANCVAVTNTDEPKAMRLPMRLNSIQTQLRSVRVEVEARFRGVSDEVFASLVEHPNLERCSLYLREIRRDAEQAMSPELESLAVDLNRDGLHAWGQLYDRISARIEVVVPDEEGTGTKKVSVGQAKNLLSNPKRDVRKKAFEGLQVAWREKAPELAMILNSIIGSERTLYTRRGGDELTMPLQANRVERATVEAMFEAADEFQDVLVDYMHAKAKLLGVDRLAWYDLSAPVGETSDEKISYEQAQRFIVDQVSDFSERMSGFYQQALADQWVEAEDRPGKAQGGFCTGFPVSGQVRIFMTFGGTPGGVQTLAHELGHAYHGWLMRDLGAFERKVPMGLAETASTLSEVLVESAALERAEGAEKLRLLDERLQRGVAFLLDIPARFRLERAMHAVREHSELDEDQLTELTTDIFGKGFGEGVSGVDPTFWASKLHFFITGLPFYNFPYTFGYLFSRAVYERARQDGPAYADVVDQLLVDTGRLTAEEIGQRYLDADLTEPDFWREAAASVREDVAEFIALVEE